MFLECSLTVPRILPECSLSAELARPAELAERPPGGRYAASVLRGSMRAVCRELTEESQLYRIG
eukprot:6235377-Pyramimonas_sp.AAC.1